MVKMACRRNMHRVLRFTSDCHVSELWQQQHRPSKCPSFSILKNHLESCEWLRFPPSSDSDAAIRTSNCFQSIRLCENVSNLKLASGPEIHSEKKMRRGKKQPNYFQQKKTTNKCSLKCAIKSHLAFQQRFEKITPNSKCTQKSSAIIILHTLIKCAFARAPKIRITKTTKQTKKNGSTKRFAIRLPSLALSIAIIINLSNLFNKFRKSRHTQKNAMRF